MSNVFYDPGTQRAAKVNDLFASIARRYDRINDVQSFGLHRRWKRQVVAMAAPRPGSTALDLCCGTGDLAFLLAERGVDVVGLDFSEAMLQVAELKGRSAKASHPHANPRFLQGDAQKVPFPDASFDIVTVGYGLRNLASWETGLCEMWRVARPGGRLLVLDFGKPDHAAWRKIYLAYLRFCVPIFGRLFCGNAAAYAYILESLKHYPAQNGVAAAMKELELTNVRIVNLLGGAMSINYGEKPRS